jgi:hypothetical protein
MRRLFCARYLPFMGHPFILCECGHLSADEKGYVEHEHRDVPITPAAALR